MSRHTSDLSLLLGVGLVLLAWLAYAVMSR